MFYVLVCSRFLRYVIFPHFNATFLFALSISYVASLLVLCAVHLFVFQPHQFIIVSSDLRVYDDRHFTHTHTPAHTYHKDIRVLNLFCFFPFTITGRQCCERLFANDYKSNEINRDVDCALAQQRKYARTKLI